MGERGDTAAVVPGGLSGLGGPSDRRERVLALYEAQYWPLVRLAALLLVASAEAEDVVQEAFVRLYLSRDRLRDPDRAAGYLHVTVVNLCRSRLRRRLVALRHAPARDADPEDPAETALRRLRGDRAVQALAQLPRREREAVVLRYYADLSEATAAQRLGVSVGAVKGYASRGLAKLASLLEEDEE